MERKSKISFEQLAAMPDPDEGSKEYGSEEENYNSDNEFAGYSSDENEAISYLKTGSSDDFSDDDTKGGGTAWGDMVQDEFIPQSDSRENPKNQNMQVINTSVESEVEITQDAIFGKDVDPLFKAFFERVRTNASFKNIQFLKAMLPEVIAEVPTLTEEALVNTNDTLIQEIAKIVKSKEKKPQDVTRLANLLKLQLEIKNEKELLEGLRKDLSLKETVDPFIYTVDYLLTKYQRSSEEKKMQYKLDDFGKLAGTFLNTIESDPVLEITSMDLWLFYLSSVFAAYVKLRVTDAVWENDKTYVSRSLTPDLVVLKEGKQIAIEVTLTHNEQLLKEKITKYVKFDKVYIVNPGTLEEKLIEMSKDGIKIEDKSESAENLYKEIMDIYAKVKARNEKVFNVREERFKIDAEQLKTFQDLLSDTLKELTKEFFNFIEVPEDQREDWMKTLTNEEEYIRRRENLYNALKKGMYARLDDVADSSLQDVKDAVSDVLYHMHTKLVGNRKINENGSKLNFYFPTTCFNQLYELSDEEKELFDVKSKDLETENLLEIMSCIPKATGHAVVDSIRSRFEPKFINPIFAARSSEREVILSELEEKEHEEAKKYLQKYHGLNASTVAKQKEAMTKEIKLNNKAYLREFVNINNLDSFFGKYLRITHHVRHYVEEYFKIQYRAKLKQSLYHRFNPKSGIMSPMTKEELRFWEKTLRKCFIYVANQKDEEKFVEEFGLREIVNAEKLDSKFVEINKKEPSHLKKRFIFYVKGVENVIFGKYPEAEKDTLENIHVMVLQSQAEKILFQNNHPEWVLSNKRYVICTQPPKGTIEVYPVDESSKEFCSRIEKKFTEKIEQITIPNYELPHKQNIIENINKLNKLYTDGIEEWKKEDDKEHMYGFKYLKMVSDLCSKLGHRDAMSDNESWIQLISASKNLCMVLLKRNIVSSSEVTMPFFFMGIHDKDYFELENPYYFNFIPIVKNNKKLFFFFSKPMRLDIGRIYKLRTVYERFLVTMFDYTQRSGEFNKKLVPVFIASMSLNQDTHLALSLYRNFIQNSLAITNDNAHLLKDKLLNINPKRAASAAICYHIAEATILYQKQQNIIVTGLHNNRAILEDGSETSSFEIDSVWGYKITSYKDFITESYFIGMSDKGMMPHNPGLKVEMDLILKFYREFHMTKRNKPEWINGNNDPLDVFNPAVQNFYFNREAMELSGFCIYKSMKEHFGEKKCSAIPLIMESILTIATNKSSILDSRFAPVSNYRSTVQHAVFWQRFVQNKKNMMDVMISTLKNRHIIRMQLALKDQDGAKRHFDIVDIESKVWQKIVEKIYAILAQPLPGEMISKNHEERIKSIQDKVTEATATAGRMNLTVNGEAGDCSKWAPSSQMATFIKMNCYYKLFMDETTANMTDWLLMKWFMDKEVVTASGVKYNYTEADGTLYPIVVPTLEFVMGQFNFLSSLNHLAVALLVDDLMRSEILRDREFWGITDDVWFCWFDVHSDDYYWIFLTSDNKTKRIFFIWDIYIKLMHNIKVNRKKTNISNAQLEMISFYYFYGSAHIPLIKHINALFANPPASGWATDVLATQSRINELQRKGASDLTCLLAQRVMMEWLNSISSLSSEIRERNHSFDMKYENTDTIKDWDKRGFISKKHYKLENDEKIIEKVDRRDIPTELFGEPDLPRSFMSGDSDIFNYGAWLHADKNVALNYVIYKFFSSKGPLIHEDYLNAEDVEHKLYSGVKVALKVPSKAKKKIQSMVEIITDDTLDKYEKISDNNKLLKYIDNKKSEAVQMVKAAHKLRNIAYIKSQNNTNNFQLFLNLATIASGNSVYFKLKPNNSVYTGLTEFFKNKPIHRFSIYAERISHDTLVYGRHGAKFIHKPMNIRVLLEDNKIKNLIIKTNISYLYEYTTKDYKDYVYMNNDGFLTSLNIYIYRRLMNLEITSEWDDLLKFTPDEESENVAALKVVVDNLLKPGYRNFRGFNNLKIIDSLKLNQESPTYFKKFVKKKFAVVNPLIKPADKFWNSPVNVFILSRLDELRVLYNLKDKDIVDIRTNMSLNRPDKLQQDKTVMEAIIPNNWKDWDLDALLSYLLTITRLGKKIGKYYLIDRPYFLNGVDFLTHLIKSNFSDRYGINITSPDSMILYNSKGLYKVYNSGEINLDQDSLTVAVMEKFYYLAHNLNIFTKPNPEKWLQKITIDDVELGKCIKQVDVRNLDINDRVFFETVYNELFPGARLNWGGFKNYGLQWNKESVQEWVPSEKKYVGKLDIYGIQSGDKFRMHNEGPHYQLDIESSSDINVSLISNFFLNYVKLNLSKIPKIKDFNKTSGKVIYFTTKDNRKVFPRWAPPGSMYERLQFINYKKFTSEEVDKYFRKTTIYTLQKFDKSRMRIISGGAAFNAKNYDRFFGNVVQVERGDASDWQEVRLTQLMKKNLAHFSYNPDLPLNPKFAKDKNIDRCMHWTRLSRKELIFDKNLHLNTLGFLREILKSTGLCDHIYSKREVGDKNIILRVPERNKTLVYKDISFLYQLTFTFNNIRNSKCAGVKESYLDERISDIGYERKNLGTVFNILNKLYRYSSNIAGRNIINLRITVPNLVNQQAVYNTWKGQSTILSDYIMLKLFWQCDSVLGFIQEFIQVESELRGIDTDEMDMLNTRKF
jgi:hypothetical protein